MLIAEVSFAVFLSTASIVAASICANMGEPWVCTDGVVLPDTPVNFGAFVSNLDALVHSDTFCVSNALIHRHSTERIPSQSPTTCGHFVFVDMR